MCALVYVTNVSALTHQQSHFNTLEEKLWWKNGKLVTGAVGKPTTFEVN